MFYSLTTQIITYVTINARKWIENCSWNDHHKTIIRLMSKSYRLLQLPLSIRRQVPDILTANTAIKWQMKSTVFRQLNISNISLSQADIPPLPKITYGIQLKGSSFLQTASFSLNFLRSRYERAFTSKKKVRYLSDEKRSEFSQDTATFHPRCCSKVCLLSKFEQTFVIISCHFLLVPLKKKNVKVVILKQKHFKDRY